MTDLGKLLHYHSFSEGIFPDIILNEKKRSEETQTLCAGCSKAEPKIFRPAADPLPGGAGRPTFNQLEMHGHYLYLQTQFGED